MKIKNKWDVRISGMNNKFWDTQSLEKMKVLNIIYSKARPLKYLLFFMAIQTKDKFSTLKTKIHIELLQYSLKTNVKRISHQTHYSYLDPNYYWQIPIQKQRKKDYNKLTRLALMQCSIV